MKKRNYEKVELVFIISIILWVIELVLFIQLYSIRIENYKKFSIIKINKEEGVIILSKKDKKTIYNNSYGYWNNKKTSYKIIEEEKTDNKELVQIKLKIKWQEKTDDVVTISIKNKNINIIKSIINSWDGDNNN